MQTALWCAEADHGSTVILVFYSLLHLLQHDLHIKGNNNGAGPITKHHEPAGNTMIKGLI